MKLKLVKQTIELTQKYIRDNYFWDAESIETQIRNKNLAGERGQDVSMYPDSLIKSICLRNSLRKSFYHTAMPLFEAIENEDKKYLSEHLRYDQKYSKHLYFLFTGVKLPNTNKKIIDLINE